MPVIYFVGDSTKEQAVGAGTYNGNMQMYAIRRDRPLSLIYLGGHRIDDAPTYNLTEGVIIPEYRFIGGRNQVVERQVTSDRVKGVSINLMLPNKIISVTDRIYQGQSNCEYDIAFVPFECKSGCDQYFMVGENARFGTKQITSGIVAYDDQEGPITAMRTISVQGALKTYLGLEVRSLTPAANALYAIVVGDESNTLCQGCNCPYSVIYRGGGVPGETPAPILQSSFDGGATWDNVTSTAVGAQFITSLAIVNNRVIWGSSDVADGDGTAGKLGWINSDGVAVASTLLDSTGAADTSAGIQRLLVAGSRVYAFGTAGEVWYSCDGGLTFVSVVSGITETILAADYNSNKGYFVLGTVDGEVWIWNGTAFSDITASVGLTAATDITDVVVTGEDSVAVGNALGEFAENFAVSVDQTAWSQTAAFASGVFGSSGDDRNYRFIAGSGNELFRRDLTTQQVFEQIASLEGDVTASVAGSPLLDEGHNAFWFVTDEGETVRVASCGLCVEDGAC